MALTLIRDKCNRLIAHIQTFSDLHMCKTKFAFFWQKNKEKASSCYLPAISVITKVIIEVWSGISFFVLIHTAGVWGRYFADFVPGGARLFAYQFAARVFRQLLPFWPT